jgi:uncharacterized membrane protein YsdA (DUF1294 family)
MNNINSATIYILGIFIAVNISAFSLMLWDKNQAENGDWRVRERTLFLLALFFGAWGIYAGMFTFRHKTKKWYFLIGIPLLIAANIYLVYIGVNFLNNNQIYFSW